MADYRTDQSAAWGPIVVALLVLIAILLLGYFVWWAPAHRDTTVVNTREREVVPTPVPTPAPTPAPGPSQQAPGTTAPAPATPGGS